MTVRFINVEPIWNSFSVEINKRATAEVYKDGDVVFDIEDFQGGSTMFTLEIEEMEEIIWQYREYMKKREAIRIDNQD